MKITYQLTPRDFQEALRKSLPVRMILWAIILGTCLMVLVLIISWLEGGLEKQVEGALPFVGVLVGWTLIITVFPRWSAYKQFKSSSTLQGPISSEFSDDGFRMESINGMSRMAWSTFYKWREQKSVFVIYPSLYVFHVIPKRAFAPGEEEQFRNLLSAKVKKQ